MKKSIVIFSTLLIAMVLMAFGYMATGQDKSSCSKVVDSNNEPIDIKKEKNNLDLVYNVDSRFLATITKENLYKAKSIIDILPKKATKSVESYQYVRVSVLEDVTEAESETGNNELLNDAQIKLLQSTDYSTNIYIRADYKIKNEISGELEDSYLTYFITIIPEKEAEFSKGQDELINYLRENSKEETAIIREDKLKPGKVNFTITKDEKIANVRLSSTSGYESVDKMLVKLISNMPGWNSATNSNGKKVDQELIFFFGLQGC